MFNPQRSTLNIILRYNLVCDTTGNLGKCRDPRILISPPQRRLLLPNKLRRCGETGLQCSPGFGRYTWVPPQIFEAHPPLLFHICEAAILLSLRIEVGFLRCGYAASSLGSRIQILTLPSVFNPQRRTHAPREIFGAHRILSFTKNGFTMFESTL